MVCVYGFIKKVMLRDFLVKRYCDVEAINNIVGFNVKKERITVFVNKLFFYFYRRRIGECDCK